MVGIVNRRGERIAEDGGSLLKADTVLLEVARRLLCIPLEIHELILDECLARSASRVQVTLPVCRAVAFRFPVAPRRLYLMMSMLPVEPKPIVVPTRKIERSRPG